MDENVDSANETGNIKVQKTRRLVDVSSQTDFVTIDVDLPELKKNLSLPQLESEGLRETLTAESIAATAQSVLDKSGWVYDQSTGTYFDYNTNLYYYPQTRLYYNYKNGCYYRYNQEEQKYEFHYQLETFKKKTKDLHQQDKKNDNSIEIGSLCSELSSFTLSSRPVSYGQGKPESNVIPCIRAMVTSSSSLKAGTLYLITCNGVVIGSDDQCDIHIQEEKVNRKHAMITYNQEQKNYFVTDLGSETGTTLNSTTEHNPGAKAVLMTPITHKSILLIGSCIFVLHLHLGYETCDDCEPGQIQALLSQDRPAEAIYALSKEEKEAIRWSELKSIKKKYGLHRDRYKQKEVFIGPQYTDRAADRRKTIGSDNPYEKDEISASYETELAEHNKGHQMLKKMGWNKGASLGKSQKGIIEPIRPQGSGKGKLGLGWAFKGQET